MTLALSSLVLIINNAVKYDTNIHAQMNWLTYMLCQETSVAIKFMRKWIKFLNLLQICCFAILIS